MNRTIADFLADWKYHSESTLRVLRNCTDASLKQEVAPGFRTLGFLAWHIVTTHGEMLTLAGVPVAATAPHAPQPATAAEIAATYEKSAALVAAQVPAVWTDAMLNDNVNMYGQTWTKAMVLGALIVHEVHHRGQLTVLMRQAGLAVPGVVGPAKEDWAAMGVPAMP